MRALDKNSSGFTLVELLIALALFAIMSLLAWRGLDAVLQSRASVEAPGRAALALTAAWTQLETDLHAARGTGMIAPAGTPPGAGTPHITASAQQLALLRVPAHCAGCWEGVVYDISTGGYGRPLSYSYSILFYYILYRYYTTLIHCKQSFSLLRCIFTIGYQFVIT